MADSELHKLHNVASYHVGDIITSLQKGSLVSGGQEAIIYSTLMGGIGTSKAVMGWFSSICAVRTGVFLPFTSKGDVDLFEHLEMHLRQEHPPLAGRDHMAFRSAYIPVRDCIDGDLCEQFTQVCVLCVCVCVCSTLCTLPYSCRWRSSGRWRKTLIARLGRC